MFCTNLCKVQTNGNLIINKYPKSLSMENKLFLYNFWYLYSLLIYSGIVLFVATPLKGRFVVSLKWLLIGYFRLVYIGLGYCPTGLGNWPRRFRAPRRGQKQDKSYCEKYIESPLKVRCHERDYTHFTNNQKF